MLGRTGESEMAERGTGGKRSRLLASFPLGWQFFFPFDSLDFLARATFVGKFSQSILRAIFSEQRIHIFLMHFSMSYQQPRLRAPLLLAPGDE